MTTATDHIRIYGVFSTSRLFSGDSGTATEVKTPESDTEQISLSPRSARVLRTVSQLERPMERFAGSSIYRFLMP